MLAAETSYEVQNKLQYFSEDDDFTVDRYKQFFGVLPAGCRRILDVGCNTGRGGVVLKSLNAGLDIIGFDCVQERLDRLPSAYTSAIHGLSTDIPLDDGAVDAIVAGEFLEHLYPTDVDRTLGEMNRVLKIGGRVLMTTPNPGYLKNRVLRRSIYGISHLTQHYPDILAYRLKMHGFSHVRVLGSGRLTRRIGAHVPVLPLYGSYLIRGDKF
jgi:SAM-dependent methyltransferase